MNYLTIIPQIYTNEYTHRKVMILPKTLVHDDQIGIYLSFYRKLNTSRVTLAANRSLQSRYACM